MSALYMVVGLIVALGVLVTFHEFGHFWVARRCGVKVLRFSVGFGTPLVRWHDRHGTEFVVAAIPLGGYVKMLDEREGDVPAELLDRAFNRKTVFQRIAIVAAGPVANFLLAILFFWVLAMLGSQQIKPVIGSVVADSPAAIAGLASGQEVVAVDGEAVDGWSSVNLQLVRRLGETGELSVTVLEKGSSVPAVHQVRISSWLKNEDNPDPIGGLGIQPWRPSVAPLIAELDEKGPAKAAGLQIGDRIVTLDGRQVTDWQEVVSRVRAMPEGKVILEVERAGRNQELALTLAAKGEGKARTGYLGAGVAGGQWPPEMLREVSYGPVAAVGQALSRTWSMSLLTLDSLKKMVLGQLSVKNLSGPITIAKVAGASAQSGVGDFLHFLAYLSISLGVLNLLPIPVLDGGHLLFYMVEWVRGRPLSERVQAWGMQIGISLVVGVMLLALVNDLSRL
ncbi:MULTISPECIES: sigma E protease regulator RseP [Pseudomonas]|uniref:Zinc metalloprotease n=1 Tax=Pseudomonas nitroreducens TaxID=46680 RepID=A0A6G6IU21_PSENT|nr:MULTISPECIES: sigma E protease regulator RseP [Pseudomonas]MBG6287535.1 sigma E protease regulator RseP [Pseudomonas nitroreducens]NMZ61323.1 sigma E protease regulator RseP [Pseudomonas nitroreducens]QIE86467.1 sigma E protease regulator RseP [Pseudomonas nitroreducens]UCL88776.1 sigma E protease regulator RseP [Pseudomonas sp. HS-18]SNT48363.1 site-2 protease. Metallo peptidase. MEROPS family M50B [Pseudomonas nitroreducens]